MTSSLLSPWRRPRIEPRESAPGSFGETRILDHASPHLQRFIADEKVARAATPASIVRTAHEAIGRRLSAVYSVNELTPASQVVRRGSGSCSQRFAVLEAIARSFGIRTRVRGLLVDGGYWNGRFPRLAGLIPHQVVIAWPEFLVDGAWLDTSALFEDCESGCAGWFLNSGPSTLFDAARDHRLEWGSRALLNQWDPIGVARDEGAGSIVDEYDCLRDSLISKLLGGDDRAAIVEFLRDELTSHFGMAPSLATDELVDRVMHWWASIQ